MILGFIILQFSNNIILLQEFHETVGVLTSLFSAFPVSSCCAVSCRNSCSAQDVCTTVFSTNTSTKPDQHTATVAGPPNTQGHATSRENQTSIRTPSKSTFKSHLTPFKTPVGTSGQLVSRVASTSPCSLNLNTPQTGDRTLLTPRHECSGTTSCPCATPLWASPCTTPNTVASKLLLQVLQNYLMRTLNYEQLYLHL